MLIKSSKIWKLLTYNHSFGFFLISHVSFRLKSFHNILLLLKLGYITQGLDYQSLSSAKLFAKETKSSKVKPTESDFDTNYESEKSRSQSRKASINEEKFAILLFYPHFFSPPPSFFLHILLTPPPPSSHLLLSLLLLLLLSSSSPPTFPPPLSILSFFIIIISSSFSSSSSNLFLIFFISST